MDEKDAVRSNSISSAVIHRLPRYYRLLGEMKRNGKSRTSSRELAAMMGLTASQIRQDFNCFGGFGQQGYGYNVDTLLDGLWQILGLEKQMSAILIGMGRLGTLVSSYITDGRFGYKLIGLFDNNPALQGKVVDGLTIQNDQALEGFCRKYQPEVAVLCVPKSSAAGLCKQLTQYGIRGFWNFSHYDIALDYPDVIVENVHLSDSLMSLHFLMYRNQEESSQESKL